MPLLKQILVLHIRNSEKGMYCQAKIIKYIKQSKETPCDSLIHQGSIEAGEKKRKKGKRAQSGVSLSI